MSNAPFGNVFDKFLKVLVDLEAVIKLAAGAVSWKTKTRGPRSRDAPRLAAVCLPSHRLGDFLVNGPLDLIFLEAALAANLITASKSLQRSPHRSQNHEKGSQIFEKGLAIFQNIDNQREAE